MQGTQLFLDTGIGDVARLQLDYAPPRVDSVTIAGGRSAVPGETLVLRGAGFGGPLNNAPLVSLGGVAIASGAAAEPYTPCAPATRVNDSVITCVLPPLPEGVDVAVPFAVRLVVEQNTLPWLAKEVRVVQLPTGLCAVRAHGGSGAFLDAALHPTRAHNTTTTTTTSSSSGMAAALPWDARSTKVFFCFHTRYPHRQAYMHFAVHRCPAAVARWSRTVRPTPPTHLTRDHWMRRAFGHLP